MCGLGLARKPGLGLGLTGLGLIQTEARAKATSPRGQALASGLSPGLVKPFSHDRVRLQWMLTKPPVSAAVFWHSRHITLFLPLPVKDGFRERRTILMTAATYAGLIIILLYNPGKPGLGGLAWA
ncbi:hypothetical protein C8F04DRAFT_1195811 [Mycena alexandri]|uniref:Uncharacterized protein n=1 Tax=Mycena alexandri TaxID=1745969 RepID=A0AAD6S8K1_9AGAR|nr:hypothetical protein C8F04DRAFT_1195811 [Mycena alexandri]